METTELKQAKAEIERLSEELEQRVIERTSALEATNEKLRAEAAERTRAEEQLRSSEQNFRKVFNASPAPSAIVRMRDRRCLNVNDAFVRTLGYTAEEAIGKTGDEVGLWPDTREQEGLWQKFLAGQAIGGNETQLRAKSGALLDTLLYVEAIDLSGEPCFQASIIDVTERKRAEAENQKVLRELDERVKELTALHAAARILQQEEAEVPAVLHELVKLLPASFQYPEITVARLRLGQITAATPDFATSPTALRADFKTADGQPGSVEVVYTDDRPHADEGPFLAEEGALINTLADMLRIFYDRRRAEEQLRRSNEELRALSARLHSVREEESTRIAREIHDELGAALTALKWDMEEINEVIAETTDAARLADLHEKVARMITLADNTVEAIRRIASELRPTALEEFGLAEALRWHAEQFQARTGLAVTCDCTPDREALSREHAIAVFRIVQEALTNVLRHAQATRVEIKLRHEQDHCTLTISDNGRGITEAEKSGPQSLGLLGMQERAHLLGGDIRIEGSAGRGTVITVRVPAPSKT